LYRIGLSQWAFFQLSLLHLDCTSASYISRLSALLGKNVGDEENDLDEFI